MQIVSTPNNKRDKDQLELLLERKFQLKAEIAAQRNHVVNSTKKLLSPESIASSIVNFAFSLVDRKMSVFAGLKSGFRMFKTVASLLKDQWLKNMASK